jgi:Antibiotic biosynthesis monooxygenase
MVMPPRRSEEAAHFDFLFALTRECLDDFFRVIIRIRSPDNSLLYLSLTIVTPQPGKERSMAKHMRNFAHSLESCPGLILVRVMREKGSSTLLGISIWKSEDAFNSAMLEVDVPPKVPINTIRKDIQSRQFVDI